MLRIESPDGAALGAGEKGFIREKPFQLGVVATSL
jgi:hypothetical protein